ncbi:hypothetical protein phiK7A1_141 [Pseudomonas phage phiK7A1]|uniref:Uncharacterized protein n=1 Tax=Pseudomonas phage phiK7A1 TaxID=2759194 RepID=A0A7H0XFY9_9CAUD|nr:hypothetical protein phiK7A1_141 [Pseudomonas phage phiK7A1]
MSWDYMLDEPEDFDEDYVDGDEDCDYDDHLDIEDAVGDYRSDEYERTINQNY